MFRFLATTSSCLFVTVGGVIFAQEEGLVKLDTTYVQGKISAPGVRFQSTQDSLFLESLRALQQLAAAMKRDSTGGRGELRELSSKAFFWRSLYDSLNFELTRLRRREPVYLHEQSPSINFNESCKWGVFLSLGAGVYTDKKELSLPEEMLTSMVVVNLAVRARHRHAYVWTRIGFVMDDTNTEYEEKGRGKKERQVWSSKLEGQLIFEPAVRFGPVFIGASWDMTRIYRLAMITGVMGRYGGIAIMYGEHYALLRVEVGMSQ